MSEIEPSRDAKQKAIVEQARAEANRFLGNTSRLFTSLADEIERLQEIVDTFKKLHGGNGGEV